MKFPHEGVVTAISAGSIKIKCTKHCEIGFPGKYHSHEYYSTTDSDWRVLQVKLLKPSFSTPENRLQAIINPYDVRYIKVASGRDADFRNDDSASSVTVYYDEFSYHEILFPSKNQTSLKVGDIIDSDTVLMSHDMSTLSQSDGSHIALPITSRIKNGQVIETTDSKVLISHLEVRRYDITGINSTFVEFEMSNADSRVNNKAFLMRDCGDGSRSKQRFIFLEPSSQYEDYTIGRSRFIRYFSRELTTLHNLTGSELIVKKNDIVSFTPVYDDWDNPTRYTPFVFGTKIQDTHIRHFIASLKPYFAREISCESDQLTSLVNKIQCLLNHFCFSDLSLLVFTQIYLLQYARNRHGIFRVLNSTLGCDELQRIFSRQTSDRQAPSSLFPQKSEDHDTLISAFNKLLERDTGHGIAEFIGFEKCGLRGLSNDSFLVNVFLAMLTTKYEHYPEGAFITLDNADEFNRLSVEFHDGHFEDSSDSGSSDAYSEASSDADEVDLNPLSFFFDRFRIKLRLCKAIEIFDDSFRRFSRVSVEDSLSAVAMTDQTLLTPESCRQLIEQADFIMKYGYQHQSAHSDTRNASTPSSLSMTDLKTHQEKLYSLDSALDQSKISSSFVLPEDLQWSIFSPPDQSDECILAGDEVSLGVPEESLDSFAQTSRKRPASSMLFPRVRECRHVGPSSNSAGAFFRESTSVL